MSVYPNQISMRCCTDRVCNRAGTSAIAARPVSSLHNIVYCHVKEEEGLQEGLFIFELQTWMIAASGTTLTCVPSWTGTSWSLLLFKQSKGDGLSYQGPSSSRARIYSLAEHCKPDRQVQRACPTAKGPMWRIHNQCPARRKTKGKLFSMQVCMQHTYVQVLAGSALEGWQTIEHVHIWSGRGCQELSGVSELLWQDCNRCPRARHRDILHKLCLQRNLQATADPDNVSLLRQDCKVAPAAACCLTWIF